ncbi:MAG: ATP synthase F1 subunit delta [Deltaproteobacteria bacterium]|nr:ATP synthase F1 subunit delta [Deltaproteobacteria bacterium]
MKKRAAAKRYAKALLDLAKEEQTIERVANELGAFISAAKERPELMRFLSNRMYPVETRGILLEEVAKGLGVLKITERFLSLLLNTENIGIIEGVSKIYLGMVDELSGRLNATVITAGDADETVLGEIKNKLSQLTGMTVILSHEKNPELIGGVMLKIGNTLVDATLKGQLVRLKEKLLEGAL